MNVLFAPSKFDDWFNFGCTQIKFIEAKTELSISTKQIIFIQRQKERELPEFQSASS